MDYRPLVVLALGAALALPSAASADVTTNCAGLTTELTNATAGEVITLDDTCTNKSFALKNGVPITLQAAAAGDGFDGGNGTAPILLGNNVGETTIKGLTFRHGSSNIGAAITMLGTSAPQIVDNVFENNTSTGQGGALTINVSATSGTATVSGNQFGSSAGTGNTAADGGGAFFFVSSTTPLLLSDNKFVGNSSTGVSGGGAFLIPSNVSLTISDNVFDTNNVTNGMDGGGLAINSHNMSPITITRNQFRNNTINPNGSNDRHGGGLAILSNTQTPTPVTQANNVFADNFIGVAPGGEAGGGGEWIVGTTVNSTNDLFVRNRIEHGSGEGGGIGVEGQVNGSDFFAGVLNAANLVADGNRLAPGGRGAGVYAGLSDTCTAPDCPSVLKLDDSTVAGNCVDGGTGSTAPGIAGSGGDKLTLNNSIVYDGHTTLPCPSAAVAPDVSGFTVVNTSVSFTDLCAAPGGGAPALGLGNICANPLLLNPDLGDFHETSASPTIDKGSSALVPAGLTTDPDVQARIAGAAVDMGADEVPAAGALTGGADTTAPQFGVPKQTLRADSRGRVKIKLRCTENSRCIGAVTLTTAKAVTARRKARKLRLASKRFNIPGGRVSTVTVRLSRKGRRLLARKHAFKVVVRVTGKDTAGNAGHTVTRTLTLKRPRAKKHRG